MISQQLFVGLGSMEEKLNMNVRLGAIQGVQVHVRFCPILEPLLKKNSVIWCITKQKDAGCRTNINPSKLFGHIKKKVYCHNHVLG